MISVQGKEKEISHELVNFFSSFGIDASTVVTDKGIVVQVTDRRHPDCLIHYPLRLLDDGTVLIKDFIVVTPRVNIVLGDDMVEVFVQSEVDDRFVLSLSWTITKPIVLSVNYEFLREIVEHPSKFFLLVKLHEKTFVNDKWIAQIIKWLDNCRFKLDNDHDTIIKRTVNNIERIKLNTTIETSIS